MGELLKQPLDDIFDFLAPQPTNAVAPEKPTPIEVKTPEQKPLESQMQTISTPKPKLNIGALPGVSIRSKSNNTTATTVSVSEERAAVAVLEPTFEESSSLTSQEDMEKAWVAFANKQDDGFIKQTLIYARPKLDDNSLINIILENSIKEEKIKEVQTELLQYLRVQLKNKDLSLKIDIPEETYERRAYTDRDKLVLMLQNNKNLAKLIDVLGLELE